MLKPPLDDAAIGRRLPGQSRSERANPVLLRRRGSTFEFTFRTGEVSEMRDQPRPIGRPTSGSARAGARILLAEDSPDNVALIQAYLKQTGALVSVANNGREAVKLASENSFDLILMDLQMPEMDGYEATETLRALGIKIPIIALTAHALSEHRNRALSTGFSDFLTKPIQRDKLVAKISETLP
jgi:CheY-like chemotaxis protein